MSAENLARMLRETGEGIDVSTPPLGEIESRSRRTSRTRRTIAGAAAGVLGMGLVGVLIGLDGGPAGRDGAVDTPGSPGDGQVCPKRLPLSTGPDHGFGTSSPAGSAPSLPTTEAAWVCQYDPTEAGPGPDGDGTTWGWVRRGDVRPVDPAHLPTLERHLDGLAPPSGDSRICTADLGSRYMLVMSHGSGLTGVVVDDFGCRDVRLTDDPFDTAPGEAELRGTVPGVLRGPDDLLADLQKVPSRSGGEDDGVAVYEPYGEGGDAALLQGRLEVLPDCVYVVEPGDGRRVLPVFPADEVARVGDVLTYGDVEYRDGDDVMLGGGASGRLEDGGYQIPDGCDLDLNAWVVAQD